MNILMIFAKEVWPFLIGGILCFLMLKMLKHSAVNGYLPFISPKSFVELRPFPKAEQLRLLDEARKVASHQWVSSIPVLVFIVLLCCGFAVGRALPKVTNFPDVFWLKATFTATFAVLGGWLANRLATRSVRPFLKKLIEKAHK